MILTCDLQPFAFFPLICHSLPGHLHRRAWILMANFFFNGPSNFQAIPLSTLAYRWGFGLNAFLIFMSSYKGQGPQKQFWPIRMKLNKPFHRQLFHYAENLLYELLSNIHPINFPKPVCHAKIRPLTFCVISLLSIVYQSSRRLSVCPCPHFQTWVSPQPVGRSQSNFNWCIIGVAERMQEV